MAKRIQQKKVKKQETPVQNVVKNDVSSVFGRENYILLFIGLALNFLGYILMIGGGSKDPNVFNDAIFNFQRLTLAPILILAGFVVEIFAIMRVPKKPKENTTV